MNSLQNRDVTTEAKFMIIDGILYNIKLNHPRAIIPHALRRELLEQFHNHPFAGHRGFETTYNNITSKYFWPKMKQTIYRYCRNCDVCQRAKRPIRRPQGLLGTFYSNPYPVDQVMQIISIDFAGPLRECDCGSKYILATQCVYSKYAIIKATKDQQSETVAKFLLEDVIAHHGIPRAIISDRGTSFLSSIIKKLMEKMNIKKHTTSAYHPQANPVERANATIKSFLRCFLDKHEHSDWAKLIPFCQLSINMAYQSTLKISPYEIVYARKPIFPIDHLLGLLPFICREEQLQHAKTIRQCIKESILKERDRQRTLYNKGRATTKYDFGDLVLVYSPATSRNSTPKLTKNWQGPYIITSELSSLNYQVLNPINGAKFVVHVQRLKLYYPVSEESESSEEENPIDFKEWMSRLKMLHEYITINKDTLKSELLQLWNLSTNLRSSKCDQVRDKLIIPGYTFASIIDEEPSDLDLVRGILTNGLENIIISFNKNPNLYPQSSGTFKEWIKHGSEQNYVINVILLQDETRTVVVQKYIADKQHTNDTYFIQVTLDENQNFELKKLMEALYFCQSQERPLTRTRETFLTAIHNEKRIAMNIVCAVAAISHYEYYKNWFSLRNLITEMNNKIENYQMRNDTVHTIIHSLYYYYSCESKTMDKEVSHILSNEKNVAQTLSPLKSSNGKTEQKEYYYPELQYESDSSAEDDQIFPPTYARPELILRETQRDTTDFSHKSSLYKSLKSLEQSFNRDVELQRKPASHILPSNPPNSPEHRDTPSELIRTRNEIESLTNNQIHIESINNLTDNELALISPYINRFGRKIKRPVKLKDYMLD